MGMLIAVAAVLHLRHRACIAAALPVLQWARIAVAPLLHRVCSALSVASRHDCTSQPTARQHLLLQ
jgi:hypothetical protein